MDMVIDLLRTLINRDSVSSSLAIPADFSVDPIGTAEAFYDREKKLTQFTKQRDSDENFKLLRRNLVC
jgi:hypothetical protein